MILLSTAKEIARLLNEGDLSQRRIARQVGVSRMTVSNIATGKRGVHGSSGQADRSHEEFTIGCCLTCRVECYVPCVKCGAELTKRLQDDGLIPKVTLPEREIEAPEGCPTPEEIEARCEVLRAEHLRKLDELEEQERGPTSFHDANASWRLVGPLFCLP